MSMSKELDIRRMNGELTVEEQRTLGVDAHGMLTWQDAAQCALGDLICQADALPDRVEVTSLHVNLTRTRTEYGQMVHAFGTLKARLTVTSHREGILKYKR